MRILRSVGSDDADDVPTPRTLDDLMIEIARGDEAAFAELYDQVAGPVFGLARRVVRDPSQAEEVAQEVLVEVWRSATRFDSTRGSARGWILTMAHRRAVDRVRSAQASTDRDLRVARSSTTREFDEVAEAVEVRLDHEMVRKALVSLTDMQRQAIELAYYGGYTHQQVAEILDIPLGTAKTRVRDGLIRLRDTMGVTS